MSASSYIEAGTLAALAPSDNSALNDAAEVFGLLSDPGRLRLLSVLLHAEASVGDLAKQAGLSESSASHALRLLRAHRVVQARREGRMVHYRLADDHVRQLLDVALEHAAHSVLVHPESIDIDIDTNAVAAQPLPVRRP